MQNMWGFGLWLYANVQFDIVQYIRSTGSPTVCPPSGEGTSLTPLWTNSQGDRGRCHVILCQMCLPGHSNSSEQDILARGEELEMELEWIIPLSWPCLDPNPWSKGYLVVTMTLCDKAMPPVAERGHSSHSTLWLINLMKRARVMVMAWPTVVPHRILV